MKIVRTVSLLTLIALTISGAGFAQAWGTLLGRVSDPSGAAVPSAVVKATEAETGVSRTAITNSQGDYVLTPLAPTSYILTVGANGFQTFVQRGIVLQANQSVTVNVKLELGSTRQRVNVEAAPPQVNTSTSTLGQVVDQRRVVDLPLNGRNAAALTTLVAGAVSAPADGLTGQVAQFPESITISVNGARQNEVSYQLDGANNSDQQTNVNLPFPFPDALQEFSVQTSNYSAQYGGNAGAVVNIVTKSGTNEVHGDGFEFVRNAAFNARNFFAAGRDLLKRNQFGGTIGGPVVIPGLYNGHDHTFFFAGYQGTRISDVQNGISAFLPTPAMISGDFSAFLQANNSGNPLRRVVQLKDPTTRKPVPGNIVNPSGFDPAALAILNYLPISQEAANGGVFYNKPLSQAYNEAIGRIDHTLSDKDNLTFRYFYDHFSQAPVFVPTNILSMTSSKASATQSYLLHETHIFRSNLLNDVRFSVVRVATGGAPAPDGPSLRTFGVKLAFQPVKPALENFPVTGFFTFSNGEPYLFARNYFTGSDDISWIVGRHTLRFGGSLERAQLNENFDFLQGGQFSFNGSFTGTAISDFLLGRPFSFVQANGTFANLRDNFSGLYLQDDFRAGRRLTLNMGLRYEPFSPWEEVKGRFEQFRTRDFYAGVKSARFTNSPPGLFFQGDPGVPQWGTTGDYTDFAPRVGFAYDVFGDGKTSIRGGAGLFYDSDVQSIVATGFANVTPFNTTITLSPPPGPLSDPLLGMTTPFPIPVPPPTDAAFPLPVKVTTYDPSTKYVVPVVYNWNLALEHQLGGSWLARAAYVGSQGRHLTEALNLNPAKYIPGSTLTVDQRRLFQGFSDIFMDNQDIDSNYNSLQLTLEKRFTRGLSILANYTYSKSLDDLYGVIVDLNNTRLQAPIPWYMPGRHQFDHGPSDYDHTNSFVGSYVWQLPTLRASNQLVRRVFGNWSLTGIVTAQSGAPLTILAGPDTAQTGLGNERAVILGPAYGGSACGNVAPCVNDLNPVSFGVPAAGGFGNAGKGSLRGPDYFDWDMGLFKNISFSERWKVQFRAEFFNTFNRANFQAPGVTVTGGGFGSIRAADDPRIIQLAAKIIF